MFSSGHKHSSDEELMPFIVKGKEKAFEELYNRYSSKLHFFFYRSLGQDKELANDMLQNLFLKVIEKPQLYEPNYKVSTWLYTMASNLCKNEYRRQSVRNIVATDLDLAEFHFENEQIVAQYDQQQFLLKLNETLETFDPEQRLTFLLRHQEQLPIKEVSIILGCSEGTVKSRMFYMLQKIADKLKMYNPNLS